MSVYLWSTETSFYKNSQGGGCIFLGSCLVYPIDDILPAEIDTAHTLAYAVNRGACCADYYVAYAYCNWRYCYCCQYWCNVVVVGTCSIGGIRTLSTRMTIPSECRQDWGAGHFWFTSDAGEREYLAYDHWSSCELKFEYCKYCMANSRYCRLACTSSVCYWDNDTPFNITYTINGCLYFNWWEVDRWGSIHSCPVDCCPCASARFKLYGSQQYWSALIDDRLRTVAEVREYYNRTKACFWL